MWPFARKGPSGFSASSTAEEVTRGIDASGLTAIVTGATSGIGNETARVLVSRGAHVVMAVRNVDAGKTAKETITKEFPTAKIDVMELELSSLASVRKFASEYNSANLPLNILINNAGIIGTPFILSPDNVELQFATNHLGHFLLTNLLLDNMRKTARESQKEGRIVIVASEGHRVATSFPFDKINDQSSYNRVYSYAYSKLANILHASELARRLKQDEGVPITANSLHPGAIGTNIVKIPNIVRGVLVWLTKPFIKTIPQGAATSCYVALHPQVTGITGEYFSDCNISKPSILATNEELAKEMWDFCMNLTKPK